MNVSLVLAIVSLTLQFSTTVAIIAIARAPGWQRVRWFALVAFSAGVYSFSDAVALLVPKDTSGWVPRVNMAVAAVHTAAWVIYTYTDADGRWSSLARWLRWWVVGGVVVAAIVGLGGFSVEALRIPIEIPALGVQRPVSRLTAIGRLTALIPLLSIVIAAVGQFRRARSGEPGAMAVVIGFVLFMLFGLEEALVAAGLLNFIFLADLGYICVTIPVTMQLLQRFTRDADRLDRLSVHLSEEVERRTRERDEARATLVEQQRMAALGRLAAGVGHEINNPLQYLQFSLEELRHHHGPQADGTAREALDHAIEGADRIRQVVEGLRTYVRPGTEELTQLDVRDVVQAAVRVGAPQWRQDVTIDLDLGDVPLVRGNEGRLVQVILNPLVNGAQSMQAHGDAGRMQLRVSTRTATDGWAEIEVRDGGSGFEPGIMARLGEPYVTTKSTTGGTGLGLFVSRGIIQAHGGAMEFQNAPDGGAVVLIRLPPVTAASAVVSERDEQSASVVHATSGDVESQLRVMVVEDDTAALRAIERGLVIEGITVIAHSNARAALDWLKQNTVDLVVTDLMMPGMSGWEFAAALADHHPRLREQLVVLTGGAATPEAQRFVESPGLLVLSKPITRQELAGHLRQRV